MKANVNLITLVSFLGWNRSIHCIVTCSSLCQCFPQYLCKLTEQKPSIPVLIVSLDGMGSEYISGRFANTPYLDYVARTGVKSDYMYNQFPTSTWPNHHSMMTGLYPESHGIVANDFWDPEFKETFYHGSDSTNYDPKFWNESEPLWLTLERHGNLSGTYFWPGTYSYEQKPSYYEPLECCRNCSFVKWMKPSANETYCQPNFKEPFHERIDKIINWLRNPLPPKFVAVHFDIPDSTGHEFGPDSVQYKNAIECADREIVGYLVNSLNFAQLLDKVNLLFVSDHGFVETRSSRQVFLDDYVDLDTFRCVKDQAMAQIWPKDGKEDEIYHNLTVKGHPYITVYKKEEIPEYFHWKHNRRIPPVLVLADLGWVVQAKRNPGNWTQGAHTYSNLYKGMWAMFFARGPAFREGYTATPFRNIDLYPLMCHLLGVNARPNNGSFDNVKLTLKESILNPCTPCSTSNNKK